MNTRSLNKLRCPKTGGLLKLTEVEKAEGDIVISGKLTSETGEEYLIKEGIPDLTSSDDLIDDASFARNYYAGIAETYDQNVDITFTLYNEDELQVRNYMIDLLNLKPDYRVLEVSAGTGKDSELISGRLNEQGELFCLDLSPDMLKFAKEKVKNSKAPVELICGTACSLPFPDNSFDALYCFAGVGHFPCLKKALNEMARVVKVGGKVVFCEKHVPIWLRNTTYGKILINNNPMFAYEAPLEYIPISARNVGIRWINGNVHYVVDYTVGEGEPKGNFDMILPGARGGSFNSRYFGKLEGVSPETKKLAIEAREKLGISMYDWLEDIIKKEAEKILSKPSQS